MHTFETARQILLDCTHHVDTPCEVRLDTRTTLHICAPCWNAHVYARREAEKEYKRQQKAQEKPDCHRCGKKPHRYLLAQYKLCAACKKATLQEHEVHAARAGFLALGAGLLCDTSTWAFRTQTQAQHP